ncbi:Hypothetical protein, putative [Bodo saltans]|uniref:COMM domain-containing protein n=1 Tax=Bodo saltans TaxID=75058 RepID=A0A0S4JVK1_BODSA|nr:Hypothetical protein, putative [Bodo saltans]|eukprot:CUG93156.1 Hypothetical protein, putative [Bodo saltans]
MKFRVFGGLDCPDSVLAQLSIVSNLSPAVVAKLVDHCTNTISFSAEATTAGGAASGSVGTSRWSDIARETLMLQQSLSGADFGLTPAGTAEVVDSLTFAQAITAIHTLVSNITRYNVAKEAATEDLTMLGLDPAVAEVIVTGTLSGYAQLRTALIRQTPSHHAVRGVQFTAVQRAAGEFDSATNTFSPVSEESQEEEAPSLATLIRSKWLVDSSRHADSASGVVIDLSLDKARALLVELMTARELLRTQNVIVA